MAEDIKNLSKKKKKKMIAMQFQATFKKKMQKSPTTDAALFFWRTNANLLINFVPARG